MNVHKEFKEVDRVVSRFLKSEPTYPITLSQLARRRRHRLTVFLILTHGLVAFIAYVVGAQRMVKILRPAITARFEARP